MNPLDICLTEENYSGILGIRLAAATKTHLPTFQTQLYKTGVLASSTEIIAAFEKFVRVQFSEIELSEQIGQSNRRLTFDLSVEIVHSLGLSQFEAWFNIEIRNKPIAVEITTNNGQEYIFAPMACVFRYIAPAEETEGTRYGLDFQMSKREVVNTNRKRNYIEDLSISAETVTINLNPDFGVGVFTQFGFGKSRDRNKATLFDTNTFEAPTGTFYFFALHKDGSFDRQKITVQRQDVIGNVKISGFITDLSPAAIVSISGRRDSVIIIDDIIRISGMRTGEYAEEEETGGGGGGGGDPFVGTVSANAYGLPELSRGVASLKLDGSVSLSVMKIEIFESNGSIFFRDLVADFNYNYERGYEKNRKYGDEHKELYVTQSGKQYRAKKEVPENTPPPNTEFWEEVTATKSYSIGFRKPGSVEYSLSAAKSGVNIDAYRGGEIVIIGQFVVDQYPSSIFNWKSQQVYIPQATYVSTYQKAGVKYFVKPPNKPFEKNNWIHRFADYVRLPNLPEDHLISIQDLNEPERIGRNKYQQSGVLSRVAGVARNAVCFQSDDVFYHFGHPPAYGHTGTQWQAWKAEKIGTGSNGYGSLVNFKNAIIAHFVSVYQGTSGESGHRRMDHRYMMINNEVTQHWDQDFNDIMVEVYQKFNELAPNSYLAAWNASVISLAADSSNYNAAYADYNRANLADLQANATTFNIAASGSWKYALRAQQIGQYCLGPLYPGLIYQILAEGMMYEKFMDMNFYKPIVTTWRLHESHYYTFPNTELQRYHQGQRLITFDKMPVSPHMCRNISIAGNFAAKGLDIWGEGKSFTKSPTPHTYPSFNYGPDWEIITLEGTPADNIHPVTNLDSFVDGAWCFEENWQNMQYPTQLAEVLHNNLWRSGAEVFPTGAYHTGTPCVLYKKTPSGKIFGKAYQETNRSIKNIQIRIDGVVHTIELLADQISIFNIN